MLKKTMLAGAATLLMSAPCYASEIIGSGHVAKATRPNIVNFTAIDVAGLGEVILTRGDKESLTIEAEDNLMPFIEAQVTKGVLRIWTDPEHTIHAIAPITYYLTVKDIDAVTLSGHASLEIPEAYTTNKLQLTLNDSGRGILNLETDELDIKLSDNAQIYASGHTKKQYIHTKGQSKYEAPGLVSQKTGVCATEQSTLSILAEQMLEGEMIDDSTLALKGDPRRQVAGEDHITSS